MPHQDPIRRAPRPTAAGPRDTLRDVDSSDAANTLRIALWFAPACIIMLSFLWYLFFHRGWISGAVFGLLVVLNFPIAAIGVFVIRAAVAGASTGLVRTLYSTGDIAPARSYPREEMLIARGEYREAADYFRDHLTVEPEDNEARMRLAALLETRLGDDAGAEALYKEVRTRATSPRDEAGAANGLIDLYRRTGRTDRLAVELARFAERYRGTKAGDAAARELAQLKQTRA